MLQDPGESSGGVAQLQAHTFEIKTNSSINKHCAVQAKPAAEVGFSDAQPLPWKVDGAVYWFLGAAVRKNHNWGGLNHRNSLTHGLESGRPRSKCWPSHAAAEAAGGASV